MAFVVQTPDAPLSTANGYITAVEFKAYHDDRNNVYTATDMEIEYAIVRATDYIDSRWTFAGSRKDADQSTECPRSGVYDQVNGWELDGYPEELKEACAEYALATIAGKSLYPVANIDSSGKDVKKYRRKADVVEREVEFFAAGGNSWLSYPLADGKMKTTKLLITQRRTLGRS